MVASTTLRSTYRLVTLPRRCLRPTTSRRSPPSRPGYEACSSLTLRYECVSQTDDDRGTYQHQQPDRQQDETTLTGAAPLPQAQAPERGENDDAGHVEGPARKAVASHLALAHGVEKELEIPGRAGKRAQQVVAACRRHQRGAGDLQLTHQLAPAAVFENQDQAPHRVGRESAE